MVFLKTQNRAMHLRLGMNIHPNFSLTKAWQWVQNLRPITFED